MDSFYDLPFGLISEYGSPQRIARHGCQCDSSQSQSVFTEKRATGLLEVPVAKRIHGESSYRVVCAEGCEA
jgi:hypothetical protein